ncbi:putative alpha/beta hydrolase family protein DUF2235 [Pseudoxanthomonas sp. 3HH-4]|uniref:T6SS phospholipase effector Tle1-like catalytic domain-containing protein n=1 Tax=Pseudoxanthomonas sp. 3HH-4 TaxID=1690214 RepID=UPI00114FCEA8|nr:DUF2235 domain-containing protein [Pseudoxanthomonas sp. 3HH-4]TQM05693.1 putative alpha/beta hydrolase family protein DUF2235 [Pseudoxanthomonas sp. 3HH-4]
MGGERHPDGVSTITATASDLASFPHASEQLAGFSAPVLHDSGRSDDRLFIAAFDGTGNSMMRDAPENHTNVARIAKQIESLRDPTIAQGYVEGPGTQGGLSGTYDLASGYTYEARMEDMYLQFVKQSAAWLKENPGADIRLAAIGFSRGAEQAAGFTRLVEERGIKNPEGAQVTRDGDGRVLRVNYIGPPLREPGTVIQAVGLFDPVGTGEPRDHDRRLPPSVVSGFQITADDERRNLFQSTRVMDPGVTDGGRFLNVTVAGAHSDIGGGYSQDGIGIRSGNLMIDYLNALSDTPYLEKREEPIDSARNVIHRSEEHQFFYRTSVYDKAGARGMQEELAPGTLCRIDCLDAQPRNQALARELAWRPVEIGPVPETRSDTAAPARAGDMVESLLDAAKRGDGAAIERISRDGLQGAAGQAWLQVGQQRLEAASLVQTPAIERPQEPALAR